MKKVLVTGISGYIGQHCALELLKQGYAVRGSVRNMAKKDKIIGDLSKDFDTEGKLEFCKLDLLNDAGWDAAMEGCDYVLHVASPFINKEPKDENLYIKPAVEGTQRALKAAKKAGIKRMVLTSSMVSMLGDADESIEMNQSSWTNVHSKNVSAYAKSKTLAEKSAWKFIKEQDKPSPLELVVVNPGPVFGPTLSGDLSGASMGMYRDLILGKMPMLPQASINMSDVRDIAKIHVLALENEAANGQRFIVGTEKPYSFQEMAQVMKSNGSDKVRTKLAPNFLLKLMANFNRDLKSMRGFIGKTYTADVSPAMKTFDWKPYDFKSTVLDTAKSVQQVIDNK